MQPRMMAGFDPRPMPGFNMYPPPTMSGPVGNPHEQRNLTVNDVEIAAGGFPGMYQSPQAAQNQVFIEYFTPEGIPYYYNAITKATQWERPPPNAYLIPTPTQKLEPRPIFGQPSLGFAIKERPVRPAHGGVRNCLILRREEDLQDATCSYSIFPTIGVTCKHHFGIAEQDLHSHFAPYGNLISTRIMMDKMTGRNKGYGIFNILIPNRVCEL